MIDGQARTLKLTLGALAGLEHALEAGSLVDLVHRFESGAFTTADVLALIVAGLRGGGMIVTPDEVGCADIEGGPIAAARAAAELLARAFTLPDGT